MLVGKDLMHRLNYLSSHLATNLHFTKCYNFGFRESMNASEDVVLYPKVSFFNALPNLAIVVSRAKRLLVILNELLNQ